MTPIRRAKRTRMILVLLSVLCVAAGAALVSTALEDNIMFFRAPSEVLAEPPAQSVRFRVGGLVEEGSVIRSGDDVEFAVTDGEGSIKIQYVGLLPDLFREGQGIVAEGALEASGAFRATSILAKHDENYMPAEVADALKERGIFQEPDGSFTKKDGASYAR